MSVKTGMCAICGALEGLPCTFMTGGKRIGTPMATKHEPENPLFAIGPMLKEIVACAGLPSDDPRRIAAIAEKNRLIALIAIEDIS